MRACIALFFAVAAAGCLEVDAPNGSLKCASDPNRPCPHGYFCAVDNTCWKDGSATTARSRKLGAACVSRDGCDSGFCTDGVCCESPCSGNCQACDGGGGTCRIISGKPHGFRACPSSDVTVCAATCDGTSSDCTYPGPSTQCHGPSCSAPPAILTAATYCNGLGFCSPPDGMMINSYCPAPANATAVCAGDQCDFTCNLHYQRQGDGCVPGDM